MIGDGKCWRKMTQGNGARAPWIGGDGSCFIE